MYNLLLRSCKLTGAFIIHPCLPFVGVIANSRASSLHGHYPASSLLLAPPPPSRLSTDFLVLPVIRLPCFRRFLARDEWGFSSCLAHPCHRAAALTPPECPVVSASLRRSMLPSPHEGRLGLWAKPFRGQLCVHFRCGPTTRSPSRGL